MDSENTNILVVEIGKKNKTYRSLHIEICQTIEKSQNYTKKNIIGQSDQSQSQKQC